MKYTLNAYGNTATFNSIGGEMVSFTDKNNLLRTWTGDENYWNGFAPILFPVIGFLKNDFTKFNGKIFNTPKHGVVRKKQFELFEKTDDSITFFIKEDDETLALYPYAFNLFIKHTLNEDGFITELKVLNTGESDLPFTLGGHPSFNIPLDASESFDDYSLIFDLPQKNPLVTNENNYIYSDKRKELAWDGKTLNLNYPLFSDDAFIFDNITVNKLTVSSKKHSFEFFFNGLENLAIWTQPLKNSKFLCIEPWQGLPAFDNESEDFCDKKGVVILNKNQEYNASYGIKY